MKSVNKGDIGGGFKNCYEDGFVVDWEVSDGA